jgi:CHASE1-domain containing sensor protein
MKNLNIWIAWLMLIISLLITFTAIIYVKSEIDIKSETEFRFECKNIANKIEIRLHAHAQLLRSGVAFFMASDTVCREHWKNFIDQSKIDLNLPGILGTGFSLRIPKDNLSEHIQKIRKEGYPGQTHEKESQYFRQPELSSSFANFKFPVFQNKILN